MAERTYIGPLARGRVDLAGRVVSFERGVPVEVSSDEAALLDDDWSTPKSHKPTAKKGSAPDPKES